MDAGIVRMHGWMSQISETARSSRRDKLVMANRQATTELCNTIAVSPWQIIGSAPDYL